MIGTVEKVVLGLFIFLVLFLIFFLIKKIKKNKEFTKTIKPSRFLNETDLSAIKYVDLEANLSVNLLIRRRVPRTKLQKSVWEFTNLDFSISSVYRHKRVIHNFYLQIEDKTIEVVVPDVFLPYLKPGERYVNKTIELLYHLEFFVLYSVEGIINYPELHKKLQLKGGFDEDFSSMRPATKEEKKAFSASKWINTWGLILPFIYPMCILGIMDEGLGISIVFLPFLLLVCIPLLKAYKKRKKYIDSRMVYTLEGRIWFNEEKYIYQIDDKPLKLHRKWKKLFKKNKLPIENATIEVLVHTYDELDLKAQLKLQPIRLESSTLKINEQTHKSTRWWGIPLLYLISTGTVCYLAPQMSYVLTQGSNIDYSSEDLLFSFVMTAIWWGFILITFYLTFIFLKRIKGHFFSKEIY